MVKKHPDLYVYILCIDVFSKTNSTSSFWTSPQSSLIASCTCVEHWPFIGHSWTYNSLFSKENPDLECHYLGLLDPFFNQFIKLTMVYYTNYILMMLELFRKDVEAVRLRICIMHVFGLWTAGLRLWNSVPSPAVSQTPYPSCRCHHLAFPLHQGSPNYGPLAGSGSPGPPIRHAVPFPKIQNIVRKTVNDSGNYHFLADSL